MPLFVMNAHSASTLSVVLKPAHSKSTSKVTVTLLVLCECECLQSFRLHFQATIFT